MTLNINTDVILANLFQNNTQLSFEDINSFYKYLVICYLYNGTMIRSDFCEYSVRRVVERYSSLFSLFESSDGKLFITKSVQPNLDFFMSAYNDDDTGYIARLVASYSYNKKRIDSLVNCSNNSFTI